MANELVTLGRKFQDPTFREQFSSLPSDVQMGLQQEVLGKIIIDPQFQQVLESDSEKALTILDEFARRLPIPAGTFGIPQESGQVVSPGTGQALLTTSQPEAGRFEPPALLDPGVLFEPENIVAGAGATRFLRARQSVGMAAGGGAAGTEARTAARVAEPATPAGPAATAVKTGEELAEEGLETGIATVTTKQVATEAKKVAQDLAIQEAADPTQARLFKQVAEAIEQGTIDVTSLQGVLERHGLSVPDFVTLYKETISNAGRKLQQLSALRKQMQATAKANPEMANALKALDEEIGKEFPTIWTRFLYGSERKIPGTSIRLWPGYVNLDNHRRGLLVGQLATTMRNVWSQAGRYSLEVFDQMLQGLVGGRGMGNAPELIANFFSRMTTAGRKAMEGRIETVLRAFPLEEAKLLAKPAGEITLGSRLTKLVNTFNTMQEQFFRRTTFDATLRGELRTAGVDVQAALANPSLIPEAAVQKAVRTALEATFVAPAKEGTLGAAMTKAWSAFPPLTTINPFPRFWANSMQFLSEFNPSGYVKLLTRREFLSHNPAERAKIISRATLGTSMLAGAFALRANDETRGAKWYQIKAGDEVIDTRAFAPFSTYLFMADGMQMMMDIGTDMLKDGKSFRQAYVERWNYTTQDLVQAMIGINRIAGTGLVAIDLLKEGSMDRKWDLFRDLMAQYIGGFTVPLRTPKDIVAGFSEEEAKIRDVRKNLLGPTIANVPFLSQTLPERPSLLEEGPLKTQHPILRQLTGLSSRTAGIVETEINELGLEFSKIMPRTGLPEADNAMAAAMGPLVERQVPLLIQSEAYQKLPNTKKRLVLLGMLTMLRSQARQQLPEDLKAKIKVKMLPQTVEDVLTSIGFDVRALQR